MTQQTQTRLFKEPVVVVTDSGAGSVTSEVTPTPEPDAAATEETVTAEL